MRSPVVFTALLLACAAPATAQSNTAAGGEGLGGPAIAGVCLLSREAIFANAAIGKATAARLQQLSQEAQAEIDGERQPVDALLQAFRAEAASLSPEQRATRDQELAAMLRPIQAKAELRSREIEATRSRAMQRIADEAQPVIAEVYRRKNCGLLFDRNSVLGGNLANDLTADIVAALDARINSISFDLERLPETANQ